MFIPARKPLMDADFTENNYDYVEGWNDCIEEMQRLINIEPKMVKKFGKVTIDGGGNVSIENFEFDFKNIQTTDKFIDHITIAFRLMLLANQQLLCDALNEAIKENTGECNDSNRT